MFRRLEKFDGPIFGGGGGGGERVGGIYTKGGAYIRDVNWLTYLRGVYSWGVYIRGTYDFDYTEIYKQCQGDGTALSDVKTVSSFALNLELNLGD